MAGPSNTRFAVAVHVLTYLGGAADRGAVSSEELADSTRVNPVHIRRVLGPLREAGLVRSRPGANGGWALATPPEEITLGTIWRLLQGGDVVLGLHGPNPDCVVGRSVQRSLATLDRRVARAVEDELDGVTVLDLLARPLEDGTAGGRVAVDPATTPVGAAGRGSAR